MSPRTHLARRGRQVGFTLVELVTVILILGVLAAVALPRYAALQGQARAAKVQGVLGAVKAASATTKAAALVNGVPCGAASGQAVNLEGAVVDLNYCYAQALGDLNAGILAAAQISAADGWVLDGSATGGDTPGSVVQVNLSDATTPTACSVRYGSAAGAASAPVISSSTGGC